MGKEFVTVKGIKYYVDESGKLDLLGKGITDILEIKGLKNTTNTYLEFLVHSFFKKVKYQ